MTFSLAHWIGRGKDAPSKAGEAGAPREYEIRALGALDEWERRAATALAQAAGTLAAALGDRHVSVQAASTVEGAAGDLEVRVAVQPQQDEPAGPVG